MHVTSNFSLGGQAPLYLKNDIFSKLEVYKNIFLLILSFINIISYDTYTYNITIVYLKSQKIILFSMCLMSILNIIIYNLFI